MIRNQKKIFVEYLDDKIKSRNTFDLLNFLKKKNKKIKLFFLIGADNLIKFHKWNKWKKIPEFAKIVVFARPNYSIKLCPRQFSMVILFHFSLNFSH